MLRVLVVEPGSEIAEVLSRSCDSAVTTVVSAAHRRQAEQDMQSRGPFEVVVISLALGQTEGLALMEEARRQSPDSVSVCVLDEVTEEVERAARLRGASLCIPRSTEYRELLQLLWHIERVKAMGEAWQRANSSPYGHGQVRGRGGVR